MEVFVWKLPFRFRMALGACGWELSFGLFWVLGAGSFRLGVFALTSHGVGSFRLGVFVWVLSFIVLAQDVSTFSNCSRGTLVSSALQKLVGTPA